MDEPNGVKCCPYKSARSRGSLADKLQVLRTSIFHMSVDTHDYGLLQERIFVLFIRKTSPLPSPSHTLQPDVEIECSIAKIIRVSTESEGISLGLITAISKADDTWCGLVVLRFVVCELLSSRLIGNIEGRAFDDCT